MISARTARTTSRYLLEVAKSVLAILLVWYAFAATIYYHIKHK